MLRDFFIPFTKQLAVCDWLLRVATARFSVIALDDVFEAIVALKQPKCMVNILL